MLDNFLAQLERLPPFAWNIMIIATAFVIGIVCKGILSLVLKRYSIKTDEYSLFKTILHKLGGPASIFLPLFVFNLMMPFMHLSRRGEVIVERISTILLIIAFANLLIGIVRVLQDIVIHNFDLSVKDNLKARKIRTQLQFLRKMAISLIILLTACAILMSFPGLRRLGTGLLTGVGISGIIVGFAAQQSLGNILAGLQIAFTQPIRLDDVLVVEGEWGRVEEITLTYVVLNIWDQRRLILPINYFLQKPFQNWTRNSAEIIGTVFLYLDYSIPVDELRTEFNRLLESSELWDRRASNLQVTDAKNNTIEIRCLMSATDSGIAFDLRCYIRENLIAFVKNNHPDCLPKTRAIIDNEEKGPPAPHLEPVKKAMEKSPTPHSRMG
ncbi:MAG TPA: mechanosensitive ion channel domain-containing protein [Segetibacter sp.]|jgi:small-conductance mechanosensitive channel